MAKRQAKYQQLEVNKSLLNLVDNKQQTKKEIAPLMAKNPTQALLMEMLHDKTKNIVFAIGSAGTGKTYIATKHAIKGFQEGKFKKIVISRPTVALDNNDIGFLPGGVFEKLQPWVMPILDVLKEHYTKTQLEKLIEEEHIEMVPLAYIRGRTFKNSIIIIDEAQNTTKSALLSILTRLGQGSMMIVTGDIRQSDRGKDNGLTDFLHRYDPSCKRIGMVEFEDKDVERHPCVKEILYMYKELD